MVKTPLPVLGENSEENIKKIYDFICNYYEDVNVCLAQIAKSKTSQINNTKFVSKAKLKGVSE